MASSGFDAVRVSGVTKRFGTVLANASVDLSVPAGTIHGIVGENGAGKSTLVSILSGHYKADRGSVHLFGDEVKLGSRADAIAHGIGMVHQHFMLVPNFTAVENLMLGLAKTTRLGVPRAEVLAKMDELEGAYGLKVDPNTPVEDLPVGVQQRLEIIKALISGGRILILDEPTGVLTPDETDRLFQSLETLRRQGVTILFITHKLREIMSITDNVSVMRRGRMVAHMTTTDATDASLAEAMVGRTVHTVRNTPGREPGPVRLAAQGLAVRDRLGVERLSEFALELRAGEIVGIAGVAGNGQSELLAVLAGIVPPSEGLIRIGDRAIAPTRPTNPRELRRLGVAHVPEDRRREGLVLPFRMQENSVLGYLNRAKGRRRWLLRRRRMLKHCSDLMTRFDVRPPDPRLAAGGFSGGNQQKLVLAREHGEAPSVLLVGQPTRGVDIGAIEFIHQQLLALRDEGCAILLVSVELDELLALSDRIIAMNGGRIVGEIDGRAADRQRVGLMMAGVGAAGPNGDGIDRPGDQAA